MMDYALIVDYSISFSLPLVWLCIALCAVLLLIGLLVRYKLKHITVPILDTLTDDSGNKIKILFAGKSQCDDEIYVACKDSKTKTMSVMHMHEFMKLKNRK